MKTKIKMKMDVLRWIGPEGNQSPELSLREGREYLILRRKTPHVVTVMDETDRVQLVLLPYEAFLV